MYHGQCLCSQQRSSTCMANRIVVHLIMIMVVIEKIRKCEFKTKLWSRQYAYSIVCAAAFTKLIKSVISISASQEFHLTNDVCTSASIASNLNVRRSVCRSIDLNQETMSSHCSHSSQCIEMSIMLFYAL